MKKICLIVSSLYTAEVFLLDQLSALSLKYDVTLIANTEDLSFLKVRDIKAKLITAPINRKISPVKDFLALVYLYKLFRRNRFDLIHSITPKAGLLSMISSTFAQIPIRVHTFTGQVWTTRTGVSRAILKMADKIIALLATKVLVDSFSQRSFLIENNIITEKNSLVLVKGSISGVNIYRFKPDIALRWKIRNSLRISNEAIVFLYMSRLTKDKGALIMAKAFSNYSDFNNLSYLIVVGPDEEGLRNSMREMCKSCIDKIHFKDFTI